MAEDKVIEAQTVVDEVKPEQKIKEVTLEEPLKDAEPMVKETESQEKVPDNEAKLENDGVEDKNGVELWCGDESTPIPNLILKGTKAFWLQDFPEAVAIFGRVSERLVKQHGDELNDELGNVYLYYGKSLLELARETGDPFGEGVPAEVAVGVAGDGDDSDDDDDDEDDDDVDEEEEEKEEEGQESLQENEIVEGQENLQENEQVDGQEISQEKETVSSEEKAAEHCEKPAEVTGNKLMLSQGSEVSVNGESILDSQSSTTGIGSQTSSSASQSEPTSSSDGGPPQTPDLGGIDSSTMDSSCAALRCHDKLGTSEDSEEEDSDDDDDGTGEEDVNAEPLKWPARDPTDLQVAWEVLELAKQIFIRREEKGKEDYADCLVALAEVSMEGENFESAAADLDEAIKVLDEINAEELHTRKLAHTHYTLGMVLCGSNKPEESIVCYEKTLSLLQAHLAHLKALECPGPSDTREMNEVLGLIPEVEEKISDLHSFIEESRKNSEEAAMMVDNVVGAATTSVEKTVSDISHLVKRKREEDVDEQGDCAAKRPAA